MTTVADILAVAEQVRADREIYRTNGDWSGYVSIQQKAPYDAASGNDRFGTGRVDHCGISVAYVLTKAGLRFGVDYPEGIQYSPLLCNQIVAGGYDTTPQPGCIGVIDWQALGWRQCWASDHVVLVVAVEGEWLTCWETNTTADGGAYYYRRHKSLFTAFGMPKNLGAAIVVPPVNETNRGHLAVPAYC